MNRTKGVVIATAAATLIVAGSASVRADDTPRQPADRVMCEGINECAGKGTCAGSQGGCAGMNSCRGKGVVESSYKDCVCKGGKTVDDDKSTPR